MLSITTFPILPPPLYKPNPRTKWPVNIVYISIHNQHKFCQLFSPIIFPVSTQSTRGGVPQNCLCSCWNAIILINYSRIGNVACELTKFQGTSLRVLYLFNISWQCMSINFCSSIMSLLKQIVFIHYFITNAKYIICFSLKFNLARGVPRIANVGEIWLWSCGNCNCLKQNSWCCIYINNTSHQLLHFQILPPPSTTSRPSTTQPPPTALPQKPTKFRPCRSYLSAPCCILNASCNAGCSHDAWCFMMHHRTRASVFGKPI